MATKIILSPTQTFSAGRLRAARRMPYFVAALHGLIPQKWDYPTMAVTDKHVLLWHPETVQKWGVVKTEGVLLHEVMHIVLGHAKRYIENIAPAWYAKVAEKLRTTIPDDIDDEDQKAVLEEAATMGAESVLRRLWNFGGDAEINHNLREAGVKLPEGCWYPGVGPLEDMEGGQPAEVYTARIVQNFLDGDLSLDDWLKPGPGGGACGGGAGNSDPNEPANGMSSQGYGRSAAEIERIKNQVAQEIQKAGQKGRGTVPSGLRVWADEQIAPPVVSWEEQLSMAGSSAYQKRRGMVDFAYDRPSRRQSGLPAGMPILPRMVAPCPEVVIAIDTSGSMGQSEIKRGASEAKGIMEALGAKVTFMACDCHVGTVIEAASIDDILKNLTGGGGTSFVPVFERIESGIDIRRPDVLIFITDGGGDAPDVPPSYEVIWLLVGAHRMIPRQHGDWEKEVTYGTIIEVEEEGEERDDDDDDDDDE